MKPFIRFALTSLVVAFIVNGISMLVSPWIAVAVLAIIVADLLRREVKAGHIWT
jgi:hypothetical protein